MSIAASNNNIDIIRKNMMYLRKWGIEMRTRPKVNTKLHNFESRTSKYTADQLEKMVWKRDDKLKWCRVEYRYRKCLI